MCNMINGLTPVSLPLGCDLKYNPGYDCRALSRIGARADSITPAILNCNSFGRLDENDSKKGTIESRKIALISEGTPGRENMVVPDTLILTPGAVPIGLGIGTPPRGIVAILVRYFVSLGGISSLR